APSARLGHTAVWTRTGSEMIVWGGSDQFNDSLNTGARYNPSTDSWTATNTINAPDGRAYHTAVWTGTEMIVWGGYNGNSLNIGGRYDLNADSWTGTSTANADDARFDRTAGAVGSEMLVTCGLLG